MLAPSDVLREPSFTKACSLSCLRDTRHTIREHLALRRHAGKGCRGCRIRPIPDRRRKGRCLVNEPQLA